MHLFFFGIQLQAVSLSETSQNIPYPLKDDFYIFRIFITNSTTKNHKFKPDLYANLKAP